MNSIAKHNPQSMMALHLPHVAIGDWTSGIEERATEKAWKAIKTPIVVGSVKATGYSPWSDLVVLKDADYKKKEIQLLV